MIHKERLFTPGSTQLLPAAQLAISGASMHHRHRCLSRILQQGARRSENIIGTRNDCSVHQIRNRRHGGRHFDLTSPGDRVISAGKFGERWEQLARAFGCHMEVERAPYGETVSPTRVRENLAPTHTVVYMQATESSTGVRHDVEGVARVLEGTNTLLVVGAIIGLGTTRFNIDGWGVDVIIGGSQKAVMIPPGLAYCAVSDRACKKWKGQKIPGSVSICARKEKMARKGSPRIHRQLPWLPALSAALDYLREQGGDLAAGRDLLISSAETSALMIRFGCRVALQCKIRRRSWAITKKQYRTPKEIVGTVKKSIAAMASR